MLALCRAAGLRTIYMGVETTNTESPGDTGKRLNLLMPLKDAIARVVNSGIAVQAGVIVGFDHDGPLIFSELLEFLQSSPPPDLSVGVLTAPAATDLNRRLEGEGRLLPAGIETSADNPFETSIMPAETTRETPLTANRKLCIDLYQPTHYQARMANSIEQYGGCEGPRLGKRSARGRRRGLQMVKRVSARGWESPAWSPVFFAWRLTSHRSC